MNGMSQWIRIVALICAVAAIVLGGLALAGRISAGPAIICALAAGALGVLARRAVK